MRTYIEQTENIIERIDKYNSMQRAKHKLVARSMLIVISCILLGGSTVLAYNLSGGDFFKEFFLQKAVQNIKEQNYMDVTQLNSIASTTIGTVTNDDRIKIDVMDIITSGSTSKIMLRVTAKQLDSVVCNTGISVLENYRFHTENEGTLFQSLVQGQAEYIYSDKDSSLAPNQFEILYTVVSADSFHMGNYTLQLNQFGYYKTDSRSKKVMFQPIYDTLWNIHIKFDNKNDTSKTKMVAANAVSNDYMFTIEGYHLTPFACSVYCSYLPETDHLKKLFKAFDLGVNNANIILKNGTVLTKEDFDISWSSCSNSNGHKLPMLELVITFHVPVNIDEINSIQMFDTEFN